jgi:uncharacterized protein YpuA (DUF1002 family)
MRGGFINELKNMVDASTPMPQKFNKLVKNVVANVNINIEETTVSGFDGIIASWNLDPQIIEKVKDFKAAAEGSIPIIDSAKLNGKHS